MKKIYLMLILVFSLILMPLRVEAAYNVSELPSILLQETKSFFGGTFNTSNSTALGYFSEMVGSTAYENYILTYTFWGTDGNGYKHYFLYFQATSNPLADELQTRTFCDENSSMTYICPGYVYNSSSRMSTFLTCVDGNLSLDYSYSYNKYKVIDYGSYKAFASLNSSNYPTIKDSSFIISSNINTTLPSFNDSLFDSSLGRLNIKSTRYLDTNKHIYHDFFTIDTTTTTDVDITQSGYGVKCQAVFYGKDNYSYSTDYFDLTDYRFNFNWKNKNFSGLSLPSQPDLEKVTQYRLYLFPFKEENGLIKRGLYSSVSYSDYTSNGFYLNTRYSSGHRVGAHRPQGSDKELDTFITPFPVSHGSGFFLSDNDTLINKYIYEYHYPGEPDETVIYDITNNITNPDSIVDIPGNENVSDFDFGSIKAFLTGLYNFLFKLSKVLIMWLGLPPALATILNLGLYVIVFLIFGSLFKKLF